MVRLISFRFLVLLIGLSGVILPACNRRLAPYMPGGGERLPVKVNAASDPRVIAMQESFRKRGIKVITIGQDYLIAVPSYMLFPNQSPRLTWASYGVLNDVVCFMKNFRKISVNVTGYAIKYQSVRREQALTLARARNVADYLWSQGIDTRLIFTEGAGSDKPIVAMQQGGDASPDSRIEITFRDAIV
jgi:intracellular multiplication protein IcmN